MRLRETIKTFILLLLTLMIFLMSIQLWVFSNLSNTGEDFISSLRLALNAAGLSGLASRLDGSSNTQIQYGYSDRFDRPASVTYLNEFGAVSTAYDGAATIKIYSLIKSSVINAMAGEFTAADESVWTSEIAQGDGVLIDYGRQISLSVLQRLAGGSTRSDNLRVRYLLIKGGKAYIKSEGGIYQSSVDSDISEISRLITQDATLSPVTVIGKASTFSQEEAAAAAALPLQPEAIFTAQNGRALPMLYLLNPIYNEQNGFISVRLQDVLMAFSYNPGTIKRYTEKSGTEVFVENYSDIKLGRDGALKFHVSKTERGLAVSKLIGTAPEYYTVTDVLLASQTVIDKIGKQLLGGTAAELRFEQAYFNSTDQSLEIEYGYVSNGLAIALDGPAFKVTYKNGYITEVEARLLDYEYTGSYIYPLDIFKLAELYQIRGEKMPARLELTYNGSAAVSEQIAPEYKQIVSAGGNQ